VDCTGRCAVWRLTSRTQATSAWEAAHRPQKAEIGSRGSEVWAGRIRSGLVTFGDGRVRVMGAALALLRNRPVTVDRLLVGLPDVEATITAAVPGLAAVGHQR
jgi:hypothetical protein